MPWTEEGLRRVVHDVFGCERKRSAAGPYGCDCGNVEAFEANRLASMLAELTLIRPNWRNPERDAKVLRRRYEDRWTQAQTAALIGRSPERIRQIECKALRILRHPANRKIWHVMPEAANGD